MNQQAAFFRQSCMNTVLPANHLVGIGQWIFTVMCLARIWNAEIPVYNEGYNEAHVSSENVLIT